MKNEQAFDKVSLAEQARDALKDEIFSGALKPGDRLDLSDYAKRWSISLTPLRDAAKSLETSGIVEISPRRGIFVVELDRKALREIFELRICLEGSAIRLAAQHVPREVAQEALDSYCRAGAAPAGERENALAEVDFVVHRLAKDYCGNARMQRMMESVWDVFEWSRHTIIHTVPIPFENTLPEHIEICQCLVDGDGDRAEQAMRRHLEHAFQRIDAELMHAMED